MLLSNRHRRKQGWIGVGQKFGCAETVHEGLVHIQFKVGYFFFYFLDVLHAFTEPEDLCRSLKGRVP